MICEMCGANGKIIKANIEGAQLNVCTNCAKFGEVISKTNNIKNTFKKRIIKEFEDSDEKIIDNYNDLIRNKRLKMKLTQKELGQRIAEKESVIQQLENKSFKPSLKLARKLEKFLNIKLIEIIDLKTKSKEFLGNNSKLTIGDMIKIKQKK